MRPLYVRTNGDSPALTPAEIADRLQRVFDHCVSDTDEDGTFKEVSNPTLTEKEFESKLTLRAVNVTGNMLDFFYDDDNMFWGHSVIVTSMDGIAFTDTRANIFG